MEKGPYSRQWTMRWGRMWACWGAVLWVFGLVFAILGIIADSGNGTLGLQGISWLLLAIAALAASIPKFIVWAMGMYFRAMEAKKEE